MHSVGAHGFKSSEGEAAQKKHLDKFAKGGGGGSLFFCFIFIKRLFKIIFFYLDIVFQLWTFYIFSVKVAFTGKIWITSSELLCWPWNQTTPERKLYCRERSFISGQISLLKGKEHSRDTFLDVKLVCVKVKQNCW